MIVDLVAGKVNEMSAERVKLQGGVVRVRVEILSLDKVIVLDLAKLKATLVGDWAANWKWW